MNPPSHAEPARDHQDLGSWDPSAGAPSFVSEPFGTEIQHDPSRLAAFKEYVHNVARWVSPG